MKRSGTENREPVIPVDDIARLRDLQLDVRAELDRLRATCHRDAEEIARLKGLLERWLHHADSGLWRDRTGLGLKSVQVVDDTRAALSPRPPD
jgi:hypothetical protein